MLINLHMRMTTNQQNSNLQGSSLHLQRSSLFLHIEPRPTRSSFHPRGWSFHLQGWGTIHTNQASNLVDLGSINKEQAINNRESSSN